MPDAYLPRFFSREGRHLPGVKRAVPVPQPAAGAEWTVNVPGGRQWRIIGGAAQLVASAAVANRRPGLSLGDESTTTARTVSALQVQAGATALLGYLPDSGVTAPAGVDTVGLVPAWDAWIPGGFVISSATPGLQAGDQYSQVSLMIEELYVDDQELSKLGEERDQALGIEQTPWGAPNQPGG